MSKKSSQLVGLDLFYGQVPSAQVLLLSQKNDEQGSFISSYAPPPFNTLEWNNFCSAVFSPPTLLAIIRERQKVIAVVRDLSETDKQALVEQKSAAYNLNVIHFLLATDYREQEKAEKASYAEPYTPKNNLEELLASGFELSQLGAAVVAPNNCCTDEEHHLRNILESLYRFDCGIEELMGFIHQVMILDNQHFTAMACKLDQEIDRLPDISAAALIKAVVDKNRDQLDKIVKAIDNLLAVVAQIGAIISFACWSVKDGLSLVTFDETKPQSYRQGWSLAEAKKSWSTQQVLNDSPVDKPIIILSGSNMSGKTYTLKRQLLIALCGQAFGYAPAVDVNLHICDNFVYLDRASTDAAHNLSAFGKEATQWKQVLEACELARHSAVFADESFSTTSAEDQHRLIVGVIEYLLKRQSQVFLACHNQEVFRHYENDSRAAIYHFKTGVAANGDIKFLYEMLPGIGDSQALAVAKRLALPAEIMAGAHAFHNGKKKKVTPQTKFKRVRRYSRKEREQLKLSRRCLMDFYLEANEILIVNTETGPKLKRRYGRREYSGQHVDFEEWPKQEPFFLTLSKDYDVRFRPYIGIKHYDIAGSMIHDGASTDASEILERQQMFRELARINPQEFENIQRELIRFLIGVGAMRSRTESQRWHWASGSQLINGNVGIEMIDQLLNYYQGRSYYSDNESLLNLILAVINFNLQFVNLEADASITTALDRISEFQSLEKEESRLLSEYYQQLDIDRSLAETHKAEGQIIGQKIKEIVFAKSRHEYVKETILFLLEQVKSKLQSFRLIDCNYNRLVELMAPVKEAYGLAEQNFFMDSAPGFFNSLWALTVTGNPIAEFLQLLRQTDSVHLHQFANYLSEILTVFTDGPMTGPALIRHIQQQTEANKDVDPNDHWRHQSNYDFNYGWCRMVREQIDVICALVEFGQLLVNSGNFCPVKLTSTGEMKLVDGWSLGDRNKKREEQVGNNSCFERGQLVNLSSGANMSGKTYDLKKEVWAVVCAQATGFAPAKSMRLPVFDRVIYIDRVNVKLDANLSAFGTEVQFWKELFAGLKDSGPSLVAIDEAFSTSSPKYQSALTYGAVRALANRGEVVSIASHNHDFILGFKDTNPEISDISHFLTHVGEDGEIAFDYRKQSGHALSDGIEVARKMGIPPEIIEIAKMV